MRLLDSAWWNHVRYEYPDRFALCCGAAVAVVALGGYATVSALGGGSASAGDYGLTGKHPAEAQPHSTSLAFALPPGVSAGSGLLAGGVQGRSPGDSIVAVLTEASSYGVRQSLSGTGSPSGSGGTSSPSQPGGPGGVGVTTVVTPTTTTQAGGGGTTVVVTTTVAATTTQPTVTLPTPVTTVTVPLTTTLPTLP